MEFPERLTLQRKKKGFTQKVLAKNVGVEPNTVYKWESGLASPSNASMKRLAFALDTSTDYLMGETDDERRYEPSLLAAAGKDPASFSGNEQKLSPDGRYRRLQYEKQLNKSSTSEVESNARQVDVAWIPITSPDIKACCGAGNLYAEDVEWDIIGHYPVPRHMLLGYSWRTWKETRCAPPTITPNICPSVGR